MNNIKIFKIPMAPSKGMTPPTIQNQFDWRRTKVFKGTESHIGIADMQEPIWWNRPFRSDELVKQEADGIYSYNLPYIGGFESYKTGYNLLLNKNSVPVAVHIKLNPKWTDEQIHKLRHLVTDSVYEALLDLGVEAANLEFTHNDLLYKGKKFMGNEQIVEAGVFSENTIITLEYTPEKEIFERLTGKYALTRGITGIIEETQCFTKEQFIDKLVEKITAFVNTLE